MHMADSDHSPIIISTTTTTTKAKANTNTNTNTNTNESCKYKGVRKRKWGKWVSEIRLPNSRERIWLGSYDSAEKAARAFDAALFFLRGPHASFNFPHTPHEIHHQRPHRSLSSQEIQELAAKFANDHQRDQPIMNSEQQMQSSESDGVTTTTTTTESSGDPVEVDHGVGEIRAINDWSFLNSLDDYDIGSSNSSYSNGGFYKMHSGELLFPTSPLHLLFDGYSVPDNDHYNHHIFDDSTSSMDYCDDAFSQQSFFLWNF